MKSTLHQHKNLIYGTIFLACLCYFSLNTQAQNWQFTQRYTPTDVKEHHKFGNAVDIDGNYAIAGAHYQSLETESDTVEQSGTVYLFEKDAAGTWNEVQKLSAPDATPYNYFGIDVAIKGTTAVVGAHYNETDANFQNPIPAAGAVYIFERNENDIWEFWQKLTASDRDTIDWFGKSLKLQQNQLVIAAPGVDDENVQAVGSVYYFTKDQNGYWKEQQKITPPDKTAYKEFGTAIDYNEDYMVIGAPYESGVIMPFAIELYITNYGSAYIYKKQADETWAFVQKLLTPDDYSRIFGHSVGVLTLNNEETQILIAQPSYSEQENVYDSRSYGAILVYTENEEYKWEPTDIIAPRDTIFENQYLNFGSNFTLDSTDLIVASAYLKDWTYNIGKIGFYQLNSSNKWFNIQEVNMLESESDIFYGAVSVAFSNDNLIFGGSKLVRNSHNPLFSETGIGHVSFLNSEVMPFVHLPSIMQQQLVYSNPVGNVLYFNTTQFPYLKNIWIEDMQGRNVYKMKMSQTPVQLIFNNPSGIYSLIIEDDEGKLFSQKILKIE